MKKEENRMKEKTGKKEIKDSIVLFLKTVGNESFIIRVLLWVVTLLFTSVLVLSAAIVIQSKKLTNIKPLVVYVDRDTGIAEVREFAVVDARNEKRDDNEQRGS